MWRRECYYVHTNPTKGGLIYHPYFGALVYGHNEIMHVLKLLDQRRILILGLDWIS
jgi:hypothetical protein